MDSSLGLPEGEYTFEHERRAFELLAQVNAESLIAEPRETPRLLVSGALAATFVPSSVNIP
jgi:hypothetical protein